MKEGIKEGKHHEVVKGLLSELVQQVSEPYEKGILKYEEPDPIIENLLNKMLSATVKTEGKEPEEPEPVEPLSMQEVVSGIKEIKVPMLQAFKPSTDRQISLFLTDRDYKNAYALNSDEIAKVLENTIDVLRFIEGTLSVKGMTDLDGTKIIDDVIYHLINPKYYNLFYYLRLHDTSGKIRKAFVYIRDYFDRKLNDVLDHIIFKTEVKTTAKGKKKAKIVNPGMKLSNNEIAGLRFLLRSLADGKRF